MYLDDRGDLRSKVVMQTLDNCQPPSRRHHSPPRRRSAVVPPGRHAMLLLAGITLVGLLFLAITMEPLDSTHSHSLRLETMTRPNATAAARNHSQISPAPVVTCSPRVLNASTIAYHSDHRFYSILQRLQSNGVLPAPTFPIHHRNLCDPAHGRSRRWQFCLPIAGRKDAPYCSTPDRMDLLVSLQDPTQQHCFGSALHMLLVDVYNQLRALHARPAILFGTLLGAVRNGSTIPFTEDADIGFQNTLPLFEMDDLLDALWHQGYHIFDEGIWRVCIAPTHPLASVLYDRNATDLVKPYQVPYVDLYTMRPITGSTGAIEWNVDKTLDDRHIPATQFEPYTQVRLNGDLFDTVADPKAFLVAEYGPDYLVPKPR